MRLSEYLNSNGYNNSILIENCQRFHEHLSEAFDKDDVEVFTPKWDGTYLTIQFKVYDNTYTFKAMENSGGEYSILFYSYGLNLFDLKHSMKYIGGVFSGVRKCIHILLKMRKVHMFWFSSNEPKLISLYDRLINNMENEFVGYKFDGSVVKNGFKFWIYRKVELC